MLVILFIIVFVVAFYIYYSIKEKSSVNNHKKNQQYQTKDEREND